MNQIHDYLNLYTTPDQFVIQPHDGHEILVIDRQTGDIAVSSDAATVVPSGVAPVPIYGLWGVLHLLSGPHLLVVRSRVHVGSLLGHSVWRVESTDVLPYSRSSLHLTEQAAADNAAYLQMATEALRSPGYYFSYSYDLTRSAQRLAELVASDEAFRARPLAERADERFVWNRHLLAGPFQRPGLARFALPIVHGFVCIRTVAFQGRAFDYALVSRRSRHRAGVRYYARGADDYGCAANYVETEQLVLAQGQRFSFVLTRGSVPLCWSQCPNLLYKPTPVLSQDWEHQVAVFVAHFNDQVFTRSYGHQVVVNLLDSGGKERELCAQLSRMCSQPEVAARVGGLRYEHFDFHRECARMRWDRLALLLERTEPDFDAMGFFHAGADGSTLHSQRSVFRVNCIDCLDRTNVAQCLLARRALVRQLASLGWLQEHQKQHQQQQQQLDPELEAALQSAWADNADALSLQYAGTGALKADFTRTGRRTRRGLLRDAWHSAVRYARNNFSDGWRQDAMDLLLGNYRPDRTSPSPFARGRDWKVWFLPSVLVFGLAMLLMGMLLPPEHWTEQMLFSLFWGTFVVLAVFGIFYYGEDFVDRPRLAMRIGALKRP